MLVIALVACLSNEPKCGVVQTFANLDACEQAKANLQRGGKLEWAPLHCEERASDART